MASTESIPDVVVDIDAPGPPISVPDSGEGGEGGKLKMIVALVKKSLGVKDIAAMFVASCARALRPPFTDAYTTGVCRYLPRC